MTKMTYSHELQETDRALWDILWERNQEYDEVDGEKYQKCGICLNNVKDEPNLVFDSPMNSGVPTSCTHWACVYCWFKMYIERIHHCPYCGENLCEWLARYEEYRCLCTNEDKEECTDE